jgi:predicted DCC family thiol-disulfide oxidoreductase YuxK
MERRRYSFRDDPDVPPFDDTGPVAVMDAACALCSWGARMIHRLDRSGSIRICPVQSPLGTALMRHYGLDPADPESWLFIDGGQAFADFDATVQAGRRMGGWAGLARALVALPKPVRDWLYRRLARNRYRLFGRADMCALPDPAFQKRLLR